MSEWHDQPEEPVEAKAERIADMHELAALRARVEELEEKVTGLRRTMHALDAERAKAREDLAQSVERAERAEATVGRVREVLRKLRYKRGLLREGPARDEVEDTLDWLDAALTPPGDG